MKVLKAEDYQTWFIEENGFGVLVDPWLDTKLNPKNSILLQRERREATALSKKDLEKVKAVIITAPFIDHLHLPSIKALRNKVNIITTSKVKKTLLNNQIKNAITCVNK